MKSAEPVQKRDNAGIRAGIPVIIDHFHVKPHQLSVGALIDNDIAYYYSLTTIKTDSTIGGLNEDRNQRLWQNWP
jgi:hypothetical protein